MCALALLCAAPLAARESCSEPFAGRNQLPPASIFLELTALSPCPVAPGRWVVQGWFTRSNTAYDRDNARYTLVMDVERSELRTTLIYGLPGESDVLLDLPALQDNPGNLDGLIRDYHAAVGLPQASRSTRAEHRYEYTQLDRRAGRAIHLQLPPTGLGEPVLTWRVRGGEFDWLWWRQVLWAWRIALKLPLGDGSPAISSGAADAGAGLMLDAPLVLPFGRVGLFGHLGVAYLSATRATVFDSLHWVPMGGVGLVGPTAWGLRPVLQWQASLARYTQVPFGALGRAQTQFQGGVQFDVARALVSVGFTEDSLSTSEDIGFFAGVRLPAF